MIRSGLLPQDVVAWPDFAGTGLESPAGSADLRAFRCELRAFFAKMLPAELAFRIKAGFHASRADMRRWATCLHARGWSAPHWPREHGGTGWSPLQRYVFEEESALAGAPSHGIQGLSLIGPVLYTFGSADQKARYLPRILDGSELWAQGFSESGAGSDLASLTTRADRVDGGWRLNGRKLWTSQFHLAEQFYCLARTDRDAKPQRGLSIFVMPTTTPGLASRPIVSIDGAQELNEVTLDDVMLPADRLVGEAGRGWSYAKFLLANERAWAAEVPRVKRLFGRLVNLVRDPTDADARLSPEVMGRLEAEIMALEALTLIALEEQEAGIDAPIAGSILKVRGSELQQKIHGLHVEVLGREAASFHAPDGLGGDAACRGAGAVGDAIFHRAASIYGGANEVQRDLIARTVLEG